MKTVHAVLLAVAATSLVLAAPRGALATPPASESASTADPVAPAVGQRAPDFSLPSTSGGKVRLHGLKGKTIVLYFYPKDETPGCTHEACDFRDHHAALDSAGVVLLGVSMDDLDSHRHFIDKEHLPFPLLADTDGKVCKAYGVLRERQRDGKTVTGIQRTTFVIDKTGKVARVWPKVDVNGHVEDVLAFVRAG